MHLEIEEENKLTFYQKAIQQGVDIVTATIGRAMGKRIGNK